VKEFYEKIPGLSHNLLIEKGTCENFNLSRKDCTSGNGVVKQRKRLKTANMA